MTVIHSGSDQENILPQALVDKLAIDKAPDVCVYVCVFVCTCAQSCLTLCDLMDCSWPGSSVHGISQARILEKVAIPPLGDLPNPGIKLVCHLCLLHWQH